MAKNVKVRGVVYTSVPQVHVPLADDSGDATFRDTSDADVTEADVVGGKIFYNANGRGVGAYQAVSVSQDPSTKILSIR